MTTAKSSLCVELDRATNRTIDSRTANLQSVSWSGYGNSNVETRSVFYRRIDLPNPVRNSRLSGTDYRWSTPDGKLLNVEARLPWNTFLWTGQLMACRRCFLFFKSSSTFSFYSFYLFSWKIGGKSCYDTNSVWIFSWEIIVLLCSLFFLQWNYRWEVG